MKSKVKFAAPSSGIFTVGNAYKNKQSNAIVLCILGGDAPTFNGVVLWQGIGSLNLGEFYAALDKKSYEPFSGTIELTF
jgi:hypothetical protein